MAYLACPRTRSPHDAHLFLWRLVLVCILCHLRVAMDLFVCSEEDRNDSFAGGRRHPEGAYGVVHFLVPENDGVKGAQHGGFETKTKTGMGLTVGLLGWYALIKRANSSIH